MTDFLGIDNGLQGAVVRIGRLGLLTYYDDYTVKVKKGKSRKIVYDLSKIEGIVSNLPPCVAFLEKAQAFPNQGSVSNFSTGFGFALWQMALTIKKIPFQIISPKEWQKEFGIVGSKGDTKNQAYIIAKRLYPYAVLKTERNRILDGRCDALLMAEYGRRKYI